MKSEDKQELKLRKYKTYRNFVRFLIASCGMWPDYGPQAVQNTLRLFSAFATSCVMCSLILYIIKVAATIVAFTRHLSMLIGFIAAFMKVNRMSFSSYR